MTTRTKLTIVLCAVVFGTIALLLIKPTPLKVHQPVKLEMRVFKVDTNTFLASLRQVTTSSADASISKNIPDFFTHIGVDLTKPGRSIFFKDRLGLLFVKATPGELDTIERAIQALNQVAPQIHIKARFIEVPESDVESVLKAGVAVDAKEKNTVQIIAADKMKPLLRQLESRSGTETLAEPEVVTTSLRQVQMRADNSTVDLIPALLSDGYTLNLQATVSAPETLIALANLWDNQTLVLVSNNPGADKTRLFVFITATVVDPAGNRVHPDDKLPFNPSAIPPQP
jgi:hypothetical protein